ncbi:hypothetical protein V6U81_05480 [Micromonospora sp. CPCC 205711]|uniref:hypothetical protein n=1 Tax=Micromonospora sp. CPCC 205547 TaxID=3122400 RepID=UPI002FF3F76A
MSEDLSFVDRVHRDLGGVRWPEPSELRARARRRSRRTAASAAAAVLVVVSASVAMTAWRPEEPPPVASSSPSAALLRAEIPLDALVSAADLPAPADPPLTTAGVAEPARVDDMLMVCLADQGIPAEWQVSRYSRSQTVLPKRRAGDPPGEPLLRQDLYRIRPEAARWLFDDLDRFLASCREWQSSGPIEGGGRDSRVTVTHRWTVVSRDFAGDQAVLLRHTMSTPLKVPAAARNEAPKPISTVVVRSGDLVTVITPARGGTDAQLRGLATAAARRMCTAANPTC